MNRAEALEEEKRSYWRSQLGEAYEFMMEVLAFPVAESRERLVSLPGAAQEAGVEVLFSERPHAQGLPRLFLLREGQIEGFLKAARAMEQRGWVLKVEDGFRNRVMQKFIGRQPAVFEAILKSVIWECRGAVPDAAFLFKRILTLCAQMPKIGTHMSGSAIDISVIDRATGLEVDRGAPYLEMSEKTPMASPFVGEQARTNRCEISELMESGGFVAYPYEFWHYNSGDAYEHLLRKNSMPARYGAIDWSAAENIGTPVADPTEPLNTLEEINAEIENALQKKKSKSSS